MRDAAGRSRCFAFLTFDEPASVNAVMVREHFLDGKIVSLSFAPFSLTKKLSPSSLSFLDRPEKSHPETRTPTRDEALHWRIGRQRHVREHARVFFPVWESYRLDGYVGP
jgi:hypothetical protein